MEEKSTTNLAPSSVKRTLLIFAIGGLILHYVVYTIYFIGQVVWYDFLHYNPCRSQAQALELLMRSPFDALFGVLISVVPVTVGTIIAIVSHRIWGRVPFYSLVVMIPVCGLFVPLFLLRLNDILSLVHLKLSDIPQLFPFMLRELPVWVGCWWGCNRTPKS